MTYQLEALNESHFGSLYNVFDQVCRERRFLAFTSAGPQEHAFAFYRQVLAGEHTHVVAVRAGQVLGWCDVLPATGPTRAHIGVLGMGVAATERGQGVGQALIRAALARAQQRGLWRVELTVRADNTAAIGLYQSEGFSTEGVLHQGWHLDGVSVDVLQMARLSRP